MSDDIEIIKDIREADDKLGIRVHDHVIVARSGITYCNTWALP